MNPRDRHPIRFALSILILAGMASWPTAHAQVRVAAARPPQDTTNQELQIFRLKYIEVDNDLVTKLSTVLRLLVAVDKRTNSLIVQASPEHLAHVRTLLQALDVPAEPQEPSPATRDRQVRIVWLMSGLKEGGHIPEDLAPIANELSRYGVVGLELMSQTIVRGRESFNATAYPDLDGQSVLLEINGTFSSDGANRENAKMQISLSASAVKTDAESVTQTDRAVTVARRSSRDALAQLETTVVAPFGHPVVLCMTPVKKMTSVFIVQVIPTP